MIKELSNFWLHEYRIRQTVAPSQSSLCQETRFLTESPPVRRDSMNSRNHSPRISREAKKELKNSGTDSR